MVPVFYRCFPRYLRNVYTLLNQCERFKYLRTVQCLRKLHTEAPHKIKNVYLVDENSKEEQLERANGCNKYSERSHNCGELRENNIGQVVTLCGWLEYQRLNKFIVLRDGYGEIQLLIRNEDQHLQRLISLVPLESVLQVKGSVVARPKDMINKKQTTGDIEIVVDQLEVLNKAKELPFNIRQFQKAKESLRMQYRYLDMRFPEMQRNMRVRSQFLMSMRNFLANECEFVEVETPTLFKATPGGAQEFIVPTRFPGQFYSLVQSPQQFKQILMAGSIDRYFQIARCYRDEGSRPDRQPEFTQLDIEMSFAKQNGILQLIEEMLQASWPDFLDPLPLSFTRMSYKDAMRFYGTDKPDLRYDFTILDCCHLLKNTGIGGLYCLIFPEPYSLLSKAIKSKLDKIKATLANVKLLQQKIASQEDLYVKMEKFVGGLMSDDWKNNFNVPNNSSVFFAFGEDMKALSLLGRIRVAYVDALEDNGIKVKKEGMHPLWVIDFPLFEKNEGSGRLQSAHHPFTAPVVEDVHLLHTHPLQVKAQAYDLVLNGNEVGGGSIRVHDPEQQKTILEMLHIEPSTLQHMLDMLASGCPPHGGIALGLDRLLATILKTQSIRDVIAFPKTFEGRDLLSGAPSTVSEQDKKLYHIKTLDTS